ncbi:L-threonylcarbamoyladenylate synthase [Tepidimonas charontis]|uniref:Threonylcarbamoyl-AMP synthase n=1 Tax=Tepidimonas charontis TaxID=2267262 RepID=A0A554XEN9_9BURK|nr:L-threonylcarbamoyladenylate synthase [Tepidimonas charontis]TSE34285.1 Threonylcarbamoyl-AMP synthase [Tepidimonas charontis]
MARVVNAQSEALPQALAEAVQRLRAGTLVGLPTETVYGLAADADQPAAVARVYAAKGRPADHPLIVHIAAEPATARAEALAHYAATVPAFAQRLMAAFWPGPLTVILPRRPGVAEAAAAGQASIGLRCPAHPVAQALLRACSAAGIRALAAPSANRFGRISPTRAEHVLAELEPVLDDDTLLVLDAGPCPVGIESTIVDATREHPVLLRPGMITRAQLQAVAGVPVGERDAAAPRASGTLASHYAPRARVRLMSADELQAALDLLGGQAQSIAVYHRSPLHTVSPHVRLQRMPDDAATCARELFAVLRALDDADTRLIWVERPPEDAAWDGVRDRLQRAAA